LEPSRVTDVIRRDHVWFRTQFAALDRARGDDAAVTLLWSELSARLEVHAAAEESLFYPRLLKDDADSVDDTKDAIKDHNEIRDAIHEAAGHRVGDDAWWSAVAAAERANNEHMDEEERGPLVEFDAASPPSEQAELAAAFQSFEIEHDGAWGVSTADRNPEEYVADHS